MRILFSAKKGTALPLLLFCLLVSACARLDEHASRNISMNGDAAFDRFADRYLHAYLEWRPQVGSSLGLHQYDGRVTDLSQPSLERELARLKSAAAELERFDAKSLSPAKNRDYRLLRAAVNREIFSFERMRVYSHNPMTYAGAFDVSGYIKRNYAPLEERVRSITRILNQTPAAFAAARANLTGVIPRPYVETAIEQANGTADFLAGDLVQALTSVRDKKLMSRFRQANDTAIRELREFAVYLKEQKLPSADDSFALGRENYVKLLEYAEMLTMSPERVLEIGMRELASKQRQFAETARAIDPGKDPVAVFKEIQKDHPTEQSLIPDTARNLEAIRQFLVDHNLITLPSRDRARVAETPQFMRATTFASMDTPGVFETKANEAYYYVTPVEKDWPETQKQEWLTAFNYYTTDIVSVHEVYPGHYVQYLWLKASPATKLEKILSSTAFVEGWAHYAEQMMVDEGFGQTPLPNAPLGGGKTAEKYRLAQIDEALLRVCRLCASIKIHCQGMSVDDATRFFQANCYYEPKPARQEAVRGTYDPEYLFYTLGKLEILKLRDDYRKQEGDKFSLRRFHDELLQHGMPPITILREIMLNPSGNKGDVL